MTIRPAIPSDVAGIAALLSELRSTPVDADKIMASLETLRADAGREVLVAVHDEQLAGMLVVNLVHKLPKREARIDEVVVAESARGRGLGAKLITAAEAWARDHSADVIEFTSRSDREAANHLYQSLGYHIRGTNVYHKPKGAF